MKYSMSKYVQKVCNFWSFLDVICKYLNIYEVYCNGLAYDTFILLHDVHK